mmetsp:Transcript_77398/g.141627  ORF Transcript_77398/g.141627 Transcript_77398/m.141627 type:complete len:428 (-) Transcript_77398:109-1392(-)
MRDQSEEALQASSKEHVTDELIDPQVSSTGSARDASEHGDEDASAHGDDEMPALLEASKPSSELPVNSNAGAEQTSSAERPAESSEAPPSRGEEASGETCEPEVAESDSRLLTDERCEDTNKSNEQINEQVTSHRDETPTEVPKGSNGGDLPFRRRLEIVNPPDQLRNLTTFRDQRYNRKMHTLIPMGHNCPCAQFLSGRGWRTQAFPLDYCMATFKVWDHMIADGFSTILGKPVVRGNELKHPYNFQFRDTLMFLHHPGWASYDRSTMIKRVDRLQGVLRARNGFGISFYYQGTENVHQTLQELLNDASKLAQPARGFQQIVLIWFRKMECLHPKWSWEKINDHLTLLQYTPRRIMGWNLSLHPTDEATIARLLCERFPYMFSRLRTDKDRESEESLSADEKGDEFAGWQINWNEKWDYDRGQLRM